LIGLAIMPTAFEAIRSTLSRDATQTSLLL
jgi:hypothetical protein